MGEFDLEDSLLASGHNFIANIHSCDTLILGIKLCLKSVLLPY